MHVLTKIFIVLVSLLAVLLVPLVVVYAANEDNYKAKAEGHEADAIAAKAERNTLSQRSMTEAAVRDATIAQQQGVIDQHLASVTRLETESTANRSDLAASKMAQDQITAQLGVLAAASEAGARLTEELIAEVNSLRTGQLAAERRRTEAEEAVREMTRELEVAEAARRSLQEEVQRLTEVEAKQAATIGGFVALYGELGQAHAGVVGVLPDRKVVATVLNVEVSDGRTLAVINAGQRDGVKVDWVMTIASEGDYVCRLRIVDVDINKSTGVVEDSSTAEGAAVRVGQRAYTWPGR